MTKKRKNQPSLDEILDRPFCYYCERDFDDNRILIAHQKAKHYKCDKCGRRLNTAGGLQVHMQQVHKEQLTKIENAIDGREDVNIEIFGMVGIPDELMNAHRQQVTQAFYKDQAERRAATGNPAPGTKAGDGDSASKRVKTEDDEAIKARLAEQRRKNAEKRQNAALLEDLPVDSPSQPILVQPHHPQQAFMPPQQQQFTPPPSMQLYSNAAGPIPGPGARPPPPARSPINGTPFAFPKPPQDLIDQHRANMGSNRDTRTPLSGITNSLPAAYGLPTRPNFNPPNVSREDMHRLHSGHAPPPGAAPNYTSRQVHQRLPNIDGTNDDDESVQQLIQSVRNELSEQDRAAQQQANTNNSSTPVNAVDTGRPAPVAELQAAADKAPQAPASATATPTPAPVAVAGTKRPASPGTPAGTPAATKKEKKSKKNQMPQKLVYTDNVTSPEEKKASKRKYLFNRGDQTQFTMGPPDGAVSGVAMDQDTVLDPMADH